MLIRVLRSVLILSLVTESIYGQSREPSIRLPQEREAEQLKHRILVLGQIEPQASGIGLEIAVTPNRIVGYSLLYSRRSVEFNELQVFGNLYPDKVEVQRLHQALYLKQKLLGSWFIKAILIRRDLQTSFAMGQKATAFQTRRRALSDPYGEPFTYVDMGIVTGMIATSIGYEYGIGRSILMTLDLMTFAAPISHSMPYRSKAKATTSPALDDASLQKTAQDFADRLAKESELSFLNLGIAYRF